MNISADIISLLQSRQWDSIIANLNTATRDLGIDYFIIGAAARDIGMRGDTRFRITNDIDFAVSITNKEQFEHLKTLLCTQFNYTNPHSDYKLYSPEGIELDLVPFGELRVNYTESVAIVINEEGLIEVAEAGLETIQVSETLSVQIASLAAVSLLKFISWDDQKDLRGKDAEDINAIINAYFNLNEDDIYEHHLDLFNEETENKPLNIIGAQVLGRHIGNILKGKTTLIGQVLRILQNQIEDSDRLARRMIKNDTDTIEGKVHLLRLIKNGIKELL